MFEGKDYYLELGLREGVKDQNVIKNSFRDLAKECHPDKNPGDNIAREIFLKILEAYKVLSDPKKKAAYDSFCERRNK